MKKFFATSTIAALAIMSTGCTRIETGEVGVRIDYDKQVKQGELLPGSFNQTLMGSIITFPIKDVSAVIDDMTPIAKDNSTMKDFDLSVIYSINQSQVAELYGSKSRSFHAEANGDTYLMYNYITQTARNAVYKSAREYEALTMNDNREAMETQIKAIINTALQAEGLTNAITISRVQIRGVVPADSVVASANDLVRAKNGLLQKEVEVRTAEAESRRIAALNTNAGAISYMQAAAQMKIAEGIAAGKVQAIVVPYDFRGIINTK